MSGLFVFFFNRYMRGRYMRGNFFELELIRKFEKPIADRIRVVIRRQKYELVSFFPAIIGGNVLQAIPKLSAISFLPNPYNGNHRTLISTGRAEKGLGSQDVII